MRNAKTIAGYLAAVLVVVIFGAVASAVACGTGVGVDYPWHCVPPDTCKSGGTCNPSSQGAAGGSALGYGSGCGTHCMFDVCLPSNSVITITKLPTHLTYSTDEYTCSTLKGSEIVNQLPYTSTAFQNNTVITQLPTSVSPAFATCNHTNTTYNVYCEFNMSAWSSPKYDCGYDETLTRTQGCDAKDGWGRCICEGDAENCITSKAYSHPTCDSNSAYYTLSALSGCTGSCGYHGYQYQTVSCNSAGGYRCNGTLPGTVYTYNNCFTSYCGWNSSAATCPAGQSGTLSSCSSGSAGDCNPGTNPAVGCH